MQFDAQHKEMFIHYNWTQVSSRAEGEGGGRRHSWCGQVVCGLHLERQGISK